MPQKKPKPPQTKQPNGRMTGRKDPILPAPVEGKPHIRGKSHANFTFGQMEQRNKFIEGLLLGMTKKSAAIYCGFAPSTAPAMGSRMFFEPYVQERLKVLREQMDESDILTKKELILNVKSIAFDDAQRGPQRVAACSLLAKIFGWERANVEVLQEEGKPTTIILTSA